MTQHNGHTYNNKKTYTTINLQQVILKQLLYIIVKIGMLLYD